MSTEFFNRPVIDASVLPHSALDRRSPIWWGTLLLLVIVTVMFALLLAGYFYVRSNFPHWPPPQVNGPFARYHPAPSLGVATVNLLLLVLSGVPMFWADRAALRRDRRTVQTALAITIGAGVVAIALRFFELGALHFSWSDNAYASLAWTIVGLHLLHLIVGTLANLALAVWSYRRPLDDQHVRDVRVGAVYWYWVVTIWLPLYAIVFVGPRFF